MITLAIFGFFLAIGIYLILADRLHLPLLATERAMLSAGHKGKGTAKTMETFLMNKAVLLSRFIHLEEYRAVRLRNNLNAAGLNMTPEVYTAFAMVKAAVILLGVIPCFIILPLLSPILVLLAVATYFKEIRKVDGLLSAKRDAVERDLPRFVATVEQELQASRDVLGILENFKKHAGASFAGELDIVTADMRSSGYEAALTRLEARVNSSILSDVVRGLISVLRGNDGRVYFQMLEHDLKQMELQRLKAEALKIPSKIRVFSFLMLICFIFTYIAVIGYEILRSLGTLF
ncbi:MAG: secretion protein F [Clostridia bacterium]|nr:secretion protein F [Clostridia bacterium]